MSFTPSGTTLGLSIEEWAEALIEEYLDTESREELDQLDGDLSTTATTITVRHGATGLRTGALAEVDSEIVHVWETASATSATVMRGMRRSNPSSHSDNTLVRLNPRYPKITLAEQLRREIRSWPSALVAVATGSLDVPRAQEAVDLDGLDGYYGLRLLRVQRDHPRSKNTSWPGVSATLEVRQDRTAFPSGYALRVHDPGDATTLRVAVGYRFPIPATLDVTDDVGEAFHINGYLADAAMLGVAGRQMLTGEIARTDDRSQQRPRRAEDVPPGHRLQTGEGLLVERDRMLKHELERLYLEYPPRSTT